MRRKKKPLFVPEPGQRVRLRAGRSPWRGSFRALSEPYTDEESGEVVIRVITEKDYQNAIRQVRRPAGMPWPARQIEVVPLEDDSEDTRNLSELPEEPPRTGEFEEAAPEPRPWWRRLFGG